MKFSYKNSQFRRRTQQHSSKDLKPSLHTKYLHKKYKVSYFQEIYLYFVTKIIKVLL